MPISTTKPDTEADPLAALRDENDALRGQLEEVEETLRAIRSGAVDALVVEEPGGDRVYTLETADRPYRLFVEQIQQGAATLYADGTIAWSNLRLSEILDLPHERLVGSRLEDFVVADDRVTYAALLAEGRRGTSCEMRVRRRDGELTPIGVTSNALPDCGGLLGLLVTDLSAQRRHEELNAAHRALRESEAALAEADRRKDEFLSLLAHELRGPLAPLRSGLEILKRTEGDALVQRVCGTMDRQLAQMTRLLDDLLDMRRIRLGLIELKREPVELGAVLDQVLEASRPLAESSQIRLRSTWPAEAIFIDADPARIAQAFGNLLNNACKFTEPGGCVSLTVTRDDREVAVIVRDTGIGIRPDALPRIFETSMDAGRAPDRSRGGLGIGLSLVRRLVELHGGSVQARSEGEGRGSEFEVRLAIVGIGSPARKAERPDEPRPAGRRILVVDDSIDSAVSLSLLLKLMGNEAYAAHDGIEAVAAAEQLRPDVVLLDIGLPKLDGYEAARRIRESSWGKQMLLVAVTGWGLAEDRRKAFEAGFDHHLVKPIDQRKLTKLLGSLPMKPIA